MKSVYIVLVISIFVYQAFSQRYRPEQTYTFREQPSYVRNIPQVPQISNTNCPEKNGRYPTRSCDGYIECKEGIPEEKTCPDGLLFNAEVGPQAFPCQYPIDVDCSGREQTQRAQSTEECPRQYGYFLLGDSRNCGQFKNCVGGRGFIFDCPEGLAFNGETYRCDWPDQVSTCDAEAYLGFNCPQEARDFGLGNEEFRFFRSPSDCQKYFICIQGKPRLYNCGAGKAFNDLTNTCDGFENVTGCAIAIPQHNRIAVEFTKISTELPSYATYRTNYRG